MTGVYQPEISGDLSDSENMLLKAVLRGKRVDLHGANIRASFIRDLALEVRDDWMVQPSGIHIENAVIDGELDLEGCTLQKPLLFFKCRFGEADMPTPRLQLRDARIKRIGFYNCVINGQVNADRVQIDSSAFIQGTVIMGRLRLRGAVIAGSLSLEGSAISEDETAIVLDHATIQGPLLLRDTTVRGELRMPGARIAGGVLAEGHERQIQHGCHYSRWGSGRWSVGHD